MSKYQRIIGSTFNAKDTHLLYRRNWVDVPKNLKIIRRKNGLYVTDTKSSLGGVDVAISRYNLLKYYTMAY